jgi:NAD(P)-dependent dehydrogenase (short-subunit alcohol dehydrogenase family)
MELLAGKTVLITGGARGQGRAHAVASARAGADVVLLDIADRGRDLDTVAYPMASRDDLDETAELVSKEGSQALSLVADVGSHA